MGFLKQISSLLPHAVLWFLSHVSAAGEELQDVQGAAPAAAECPGKRHFEIKLPYPEGVSISCFTPQTC